MDPIAVIVNPLGFFFDKDTPPDTILIHAKLLFEIQT